MHPLLSLHGKGRPFPSLSVGKAPLNSIAASPGVCSQRRPCWHREHPRSTSFARRGQRLIRDVVSWPESHLGDYQVLREAGSSWGICSVQVEGFVTIRLQANRNPPCWRELGTGGCGD